MGERLGQAWAVAWIRRAQELMAAHRVELIELDRAIGDGDHGENMDRGFTAVVRKLEPAPDDVAGVLRLTAATLLSTVGGAAGPLYGTAFIRAAGAVPGELDAAAVADMLAAAVRGVMDRGHATTGEKTMIDALAPAAVAAGQAAAAGADAVAVLREAAAAAAGGAAATEPMVATKGRASYLGERSAGHRDPGAQSAALLLAAAAQAAAGPEVPA